MNVIEILAEASARAGDATAIAWGTPGSEEMLSFAELESRSRRIATLFRSRGLEAGDAVAIFLPMSGALYVVMAAVLRCGMTAVFPDPANWRATLEQAEGPLRVRGFVGTGLACVLRHFVPALRRIPQAFSVGAFVPGATRLSDAQHCEPAAAIEPCSAETTALLTFTSGTTGVSKGVLRSHGMLEATQRILCEHLALQAGEAQIAMLPFFVFAHLGAGVTSVIPPMDVRKPAEADPALLVRCIRDWNARGIAASPYLLERVVAAADGKPLESLRRLFAGGAPVWPRLLDVLADLAPNADVASVYGATEAEPIAIARRGEWGTSERTAMKDGKGLFAGRPVKDIAVGIVEDRWPSAWPACSPAEFAEAQQPVDCEGEIVVHGAHVSAAYLDAASNARNKIDVEGTRWHRTGDAGYFDRDGRLWLVGRCAAKVPTPSGRVYPLRIEAALSDAPGIARATLILQHERRLLVYQRLPGSRAPNSRDILARLPWCEIDEAVEVAEMPVDRRHHAKIDVHALEAIVERS